MVEALRLFSLWSVLFPALAGALLFKKLPSTGKIIWVICLLACFPQLLRYVTESKAVKAIFYNAYTLVEFALFACFFYQVAPVKQKVVQVTWGFAIALAFVVLYHIISQGFSAGFHPLWVVLTNIYFTLTSMIILYQLLNLDIDLGLSASRHFFIGGIFLYAPITLIIFSIWDFLKAREDSPLQDLWLIHHLANGTLYMLFFMGLVHHAGIWRSFNHSRP